MILKFKRLKKKRTTGFAIFWLCLGLFYSQNVAAQDLHFSQFHAAPLSVNPALTGKFEGDIRLVSNFRSQWASVPVPYTTFAFSYDQKLWGDGTLRKNGLGFGAYLNFDQAGDSELSLLQTGASLAYQQQLSKTSTLALGMTAGIGQRRINPAALTFDEQFIDGTFIANAPITENFTNTSIQFLDVSLGLNWSVRITNRLQFSLGGSAWHLNRPMYSFLANDDSRLPVKIGVNLDAVIQLSETVDLLPSAIYFHQGTFDERLFGSYVRYHLDQRKSREKAVLLGSWYRFNDSVIGAFAVEYEYWRVGLSYDSNVSPFSAATRHYGGFEVSAQYIVAKVKPLEKRKICPIF